MNNPKTETFKEMIDAFLREGGRIRDVSFDAETGFTANVWIHGDKDGRGATWQEAVCDAIETQRRYNKP